ncbi:hypothetical protein BDZ89DRAFT_1136327 [Hymenopellis radicata]|nr:hypothetical protein BDZ89DRAFT_1136327 [Hymenopellis radicata]
MTTVQGIAHFSPSPSPHFLLHRLGLLPPPPASRATTYFNCCMLTRPLRLSSTESDQSFALVVNVDAQKRFAANAEDSLPLTPTTCPRRGQQLLAATRDLSSSHLRDERVTGQDSNTPFEYQRGVHLFRDDARRQDKAGLTLTWITVLATADFVTRMPPRPRIALPIIETYPLEFFTPMPGRHCSREFKLINSSTAVLLLETRVTKAMVRLWKGNDFSIDDALMSARGLRIYPSDASERAISSCSCSSLRSYWRLFPGNFAWPARPPTLLSFTAPDMMCSSTRTLVFVVRPECRDAKSNLLRFSQIFARVS